MSTDRTQTLVKIPIATDFDLRHDRKKVKSFNFRKFDANLDSHKPLHHAHDIISGLRQDEITASLTQDDALSNAPKSKKGYFSSVRSIPPEEEF